MKKIALPVAFALIPAAFVVGAKSEPRDDQTAVLLRIEKILLQQNHVPKYGRRVPFNHNPIGDFCDAGDFCALYDDTSATEGNWLDKEPVFLDRVEKVKGKDFRDRLGAFIDLRRKAAEKEKK